MLYSFLQDILTVLQTELQELGLTEANFGTGDAPNNVSPYFSVGGDSFRLKQTKLTPPELRTSLENISNLFIIPTKREDKKGPYLLQAPVTELKEVILTTNIGEVNEATKALDSDEYAIQGTQLTLDKGYEGGSELLVKYSNISIRHSDRFEEEFTISVNESDPQQLDQYLSLTLAAIWANLPTLLHQDYQHAISTLKTNYSIGEINFISQTNKTSDSEAILSFVVSGMATFTQFKTDGNTRIKQVNIAASEAITSDNGELSVSVLPTPNDL